MGDLRFPYPCFKNIHNLTLLYMEGWATSGFNLNSGFILVENIAFSSAIVASFFTSVFENLELTGYACS